MVVFQEFLLVRSGIQGIYTGRQRVHAVLDGPLSSLFGRDVHEKGTRYTIVKAEVHALMRQ